MNDPFKKFDKFCAQLRINSKEYGVVPLVFWESQKFYLGKIRQGMERGVRDFKTLKGRQTGATEADMAVCPFWMSKYKGTIGAMVADDYSNLIRGRTMLTNNMRFLGPNFCVGHEMFGHHNIHELLMDNNSLLHYLIAGKRKKTTDSGDLGQGKGLNFLIATEVGSWADEKQVDKLNDSLAEHHPNRLYLWEGTANGFNHWYDMCRDAEKAVTQAFIFLGWWLKEINRVERNSDAFRVYWDGKLTKDERDWIKQAKGLYGDDYRRILGKELEITPEQIAWYRLQLHEKKRGDINALYQEHPPVAELAFIMSGYKFFSNDRLMESYRKAMATPFEAYRYRFNDDFDNMEIHKTNAANCQLSIWEKPVEKGIYVIGGDPAYGYNPESDESVLPVYRCYADRLVQVAEFCAKGIRTDQFAWIILHIVGYYRDVLLNLEITGPGNAVLTELRNVQKRQAALQGRGEPNFMDTLACMKHFFYSRQDALVQSFNYHTKTNESEKEDMMNNMKAMFETGRMEIRSVRTLTEMKYFCRSGGQLEGKGGENDDCVIGSALAVLAYIRWVRPRLVAQNRTYDIVTAEEQTKKSDVQNHVINFLASRGIELK